MHTTQCLAYEADVFAFLRSLPDGGLDAILTDLPYPTTERHRSRGTTTRTAQSKGSSNPWYDVLAIDQLAEVLELCYAKLKPNAYLCAYVDDDTDKLLARALHMVEDLDGLNQPGSSTSRAPRDDIGFAWWKPLTWGKTTADSQPLTRWWETMGEGQTLPLLDRKWDDYRVVKLKPGTGYHGAMTTERILLLEKGRSQLRYRFANLFLEPRPQAKPPGATVKAASPKPVRIAEVLTRAMVDPGGVVADPFVGSGTHAAGILRGGCHALVSDVNLACLRDWFANVFRIPYQERRL